MLQTGHDVFTVSQLNQRAKQLLEITFTSVKVEGEISNLSRPSSGHWYFTLKDKGAQVRCAMFRSRTAQLRFQPKEGDKIIVRGKVSLYENRGDYQLIVDAMKPAGEGQLQQAFIQLKQKLGAEGLFATEYKQTIPNIIQRIAVITSPTGAAIHDILTVLKRRFPSIEVDIYPVQVQGQAAAEGMLSQALGKLFALAEAYPELKANENFLQLQDQLADVENKIAAARRFYNNAVSEYNTGIEQFPAVLIAGPFGFKDREFFEAPEGRDALQEPVHVDFSA